MKKILISVAHHPGTPENPTPQPGAVSRRTGYTETKWSLDVCLEIQRLLEDKDYDVELVNLPLAKSRDYITAQRNVAFLLEPHLNASTEESVDYGMAIIYGTLKHTSPRGQQFADNFKKHLTIWRGKQVRGDGKPMSERFVLARMPKDARTLVHVGRLPIIEETSFPACITESGFLSNADFERVGCSLEGILSLAKVHASAIHDTLTSGEM